LSDITYASFADGRTPNLCAKTVEPTEQLGSGRLKVRDLGALGLAFALLWPTSVFAGKDQAHVRIVFFDFYDDNVTLLIDGKTLWSGNLDVSKENESTGLSMVKETDLPACSEITVISKRFTDHRRLCLTDRTRLVYIAGGRFEPHIWASESDVIELD